MPEFKAGDKIRFKKAEGAAVRTNGALDLVLRYYGTEHVIYAWSNPSRTRASGEVLVANVTPSASGEVHMRRDEFDERCELLPEGFEKGVVYRHRNPLGPEGVFECVFTDDQVAVLARGDARIFRGQDTASLWEAV